MRVRTVASRTGSSACRLVHKLILVEKSRTYLYRRFSAGFDPKPREEIARNDPAGYFGIFINYARELKTNNFGQGFPDFPPPNFVIESLKKCTEEAENACHQYTIPLGNPGLLDEIAKDFSVHYNRKIDPSKEVMVSNGAAGIFMCFVQAFLKPGDEIVMFEPSYVYYLNALDIMNVKIRWVPLIEKNGRMTYDVKFLESQFNSKTRLFFINSPHNPTSKVFNKEEMDEIYKVLVKNPDVLILTDEVYYNLIYTPSKSSGLPQKSASEHVFLTSYPGLWERSLAMYSFGKTFGATGWRVGFGIGAPSIIKAMLTYQMFMTFCTNAPSQRAATFVLQKAREPFQGEKDYYTWQRKLYQSKKDRIVTAFRELYDFDVIEPEGGYFCLANIQKAKLPTKYFYKGFKIPAGVPDVLENFSDWTKLPNPDYSADYAYGIHLCLDRGITPWPLSGFYDNELTHRPTASRKGSHMIRLSLCKGDPAIERLELEGKRAKQNH